MGVSKVHVHYFEFLLGMLCGGLCGDLEGANIVLKGMHACSYESMFPNSCCHYFSHRARFLRSTTLSFFDAQLL